MAGKVPTSGYRMLPDAYTYGNSIAEAAAYTLGKYNAAGGVGASMGFGSVSLFSLDSVSVQINCYSTPTNMYLSQGLGCYVYVNFAGVYADGIYRIVYLSGSVVVIDLAYTSTTTGTIYPAPNKQWDAIRKQIRSHYIDSTYGTQTSEPADTDQARNYPRPTLNYAISEVHVGSYPQQQYEYVRILPTLTYRLPFDFTLSISNREETVAGGSGSRVTITKTFTWTEGKTGAPSSSNAGSLGSGYYRLDETYDQPTYAGDTIDLVTDAGTSPSMTTYGTKTGAGTYNLDYTAQATAYTWSSLYTSTTPCPGSQGTFIGTKYGTSAPYNNGAILYDDSNFNTLYGPNAWRSVPLNRTQRRVFFVNSAGVVSSSQICNF